MQSCQHVYHANKESDVGEYIQFVIIDKEIIYLCKRCREIVDKWQDRGNVRFGKCESGYHPNLVNNMAFHQHTRTIIVNFTGIRWRCYWCIETFIAKEKMNIKPICKHVINAIITNSMEKPMVKWAMISGCVDLCQICSEIVWNARQNYEVDFRTCESSLHRNICNYPEYYKTYRTVVFKEKVDGNKWRCYSCHGFK